MYKVSSYYDITENLRSTGNFRSIPAGNSDGRALIDLSSNDYLGLAEMQSLQERFFSDRANRLIPMTSSAARLLAGRQEEYHINAWRRHLHGSTGGRPFFSTAVIMPIPDLYPHWHRLAKP